MFGCVYYSDVNSGPVGNQKLHHHCFFQIVCAAVMPTSDMDLVCTGDKFGSLGIWLVEEVILFAMLLGTVRK